MNPENGKEGNSNDEYLNDNALTLSPEAKDLMGLLASKPPAHHYFPDGSLHVLRHLAWKFELIEGSLQEEEITEKEAELAIKLVMTQHPQLRQVVVQALKVNPVLRAYGEKLDKKFKEDEAKKAHGSNGSGEAPI